MLFECLPELRGRVGTQARAILPGPYTLILPNPARRYRWLTGSSPDTIGVRVPSLADGSRAVLDRLGAVAATSANLHGGPDPKRLDEVPDEIRSACGGGDRRRRAPGRPVDRARPDGRRPAVLREGAGDVAAALEAPAPLRRSGVARPGRPEYHQGRGSERGETGMAVARQETIQHLRSTRGSPRSTPRSPS